MTAGDRRGARSIERSAGAREGDRKTVTIELDSAQVDQVVLAASQGGSIAVLLAGLGDVRQTLSHELAGHGLSELDDPRISRSLLRGLLLLATMPTNGSCMGIAEMASAVGMNASTTHRYVTTLVVAGLLQRDPVTRKYRLLGNVPAPGAASTE